MVLYSGSDGLLEDGLVGLLNTYRPFWKMF